jgi:hypothetical protein
MRLDLRSMAVLTFARKTAEIRMTALMQPGSITIKLFFLKQVSRLAIKQLTELCDPDEHLDAIPAFFPIPDCGHIYAQRF